MNRATGLCLRDTGLNQVIAERVCDVAPTATSRQLWLSPQIDGRIDD
jgi:hypothetical protein